VLIFERSVMMSVWYLLWMSLRRGWTSLKLRNTMRSTSFGRLSYSDVLVSLVDILYFVMSRRDKNPKERWLDDKHTKGKPSKSCL
jgi:hypothetical protein